MIAIATFPAPVARAAPSPGVAPAVTGGASFLELMPAMQAAPGDVAFGTAVVPGGTPAIDGSAPVAPPGVIAAPPMFRQAAAVPGKDVPHARAATIPIHPTAPAALGTLVERAADLPRQDDAPADDDADAAPEVAAPTVPQVPGVPVVAPGATPRAVMLSMLPMAPSDVGVPVWTPPAPAPRVPLAPLVWAAPLASQFLEAGGTPTGPRAPIAPLVRAAPNASQSLEAAGTFTGPPAPLANQPGETAGRIAVPLGAQRLLALVGDAPAVPPPADAMLAPLPVATLRCPAAAPPPLPLPIRFVPGAAASAVPLAATLAIAPIVGGMPRPPGTLPDDPLADRNGIFTLAPAPVASAVATVSQGNHAALDMAHRDRPQAMIARIATLRDMAAENDTGLRLSPDALGTIDIALRRHGDAVEVSIRAEQPQTRQLLADAQPKLTELAEARGLRLHHAGAGGSANAGGSTSGDTPRQPQAPRAAPPAAARIVRDEAAADGRVA